MFRALAAAAAVSILAAQAGATEGRTDARARIEAAVNACRNYEDRAWLMPRSGDVGFIVVLADACAQTGLHAVAPGPHRIAAMRFLLALGAARTDIEAMDASRARVAESGAATDPGRRAAGRRVSESGEFLILRQAGVFAALGAWVATGADFELAAALP